MNLYNTFRKSLFNNELYSSEEKGGKYILKAGNLSISRLNIDVSILDNPQFQFEYEAVKNLKEIYSQVNNLSMLWELDPTLENDHELKALLEKNGLSDDFRVSDIGGTIYMLSPSEMFDRNKYSSLEKNGVIYLPFDLHHSLAICFKAEDKIKDNLYIFNTEDSDVIIDMKIGCLEYLRLAYEAKLFYYWQYAYLNKKGIYNEFLNTILPKILPFVKLDLSDFRK